MHYHIHVPCAVNHLSKSLLSNRLLKFLFKLKNSTAIDIGNRCFEEVFLNRSELLCLSVVV